MSSSLECHKCKTKTEIRGNLRFGTTLHKDPDDPKKRICDKCSEESSLPWRLRDPSGYRAFIAQMKKKKTGKKKTMNKMRKVYVK